LSQGLILGELHNNLK